MKFIYFILFLLCSKVVQAHGLDLSSIMIYEQNNKYLFVIKGSLTAFDDEIKYRFGNDAYKTPDEFRLLVEKSFQNNCLIFINGNRIRLANANVILGHETTIIAELVNVPNKFNAIQIKNTLFKDMPNNMCEIILSIKGLNQKQYILNNSNNHDVKLRVENKNWIVVNEYKYGLSSTNLYFLIVVFLGALIITIMKRKN
jgi:hypothetical protein